jgi:hypothetical protein
MVPSCNRIAKRKPNDFLASLCQLENSLPEATQTTKRIFHTERRERLSCEQEMRTRSKQRKIFAVFTTAVIVRHPEQ